jgi:hypothetical protein
MYRFTSILLSCAAAFALVLGSPAPAPAQVSIGVGLSVNVGPPALPVYVQPPCPQPNYIWTPGYWAWGPAGYFWVPGTWVLAPRPGLLWTPGYWAFAGGAYGWHPGYWGAHVGFYGGINYGFGYAGSGYVGGAWYGGAFRYNTAVTNVNTTVVRNVYVDKTVVNNTYVNNTTVNRVSYNGGPEGVRATPNPQEVAAQSEAHVPPTNAQKSHVRTASHDRNLLASVNRGTPQTAAVEKPLNRNNRPENFTPVSKEDHVAAQGHVVSKPGGANAQSYEHQNGAHPGNAHPNNQPKPQPHPAENNEKKPQ